MRLLILLVLFIPFVSDAQLDDKRFEEIVSAHTWHPTARGLLLFNGVHTVTIRKADINDGSMYVRLAGIDPDSGEKFNIEGTGTIRFENNYFEISLDDGFTQIASYVAGTIISEERIQFSSSASAFTLTEEGMSDVEWFLSRY